MRRITKVDEGVTETQPSGFLIDFGGEDYQMEDTRTLMLSERGGKSIIGCITNVYLGASYAARDRL